MVIEQRNDCSPLTCATSGVQMSEQTEKSLATASKRVNFRYERPVQAAGRRRWVRHCACATGNEPPARGAQHHGRRLSARPLAGPRRSLAWSTSAMSSGSCVQSNGKNQLAAGWNRSKVGVLRLVLGGWRAGPRIPGEQCRALELAEFENFWPKLGEARTSEWRAARFKPP